MTNFAFMKHLLTLLLLFPLWSNAQPFFVRTGAFNGSPANIAEIKNETRYFADEVENASIEWEGTGPVSFRMVGGLTTYTATESAAPFLIFGDRNNVATAGPRPFTAGQWQLTVTRVANTSTYTFWIVDRVIPDVPGPKPPVVKPPLQFEWQNSLNVGGKMYLTPEDTLTVTVIRGTDTTRLSWPAAGPVDPVLPPVVLPEVPTSERPKPISAFLQRDANGLITPRLEGIGANIPDVSGWNVIDSDGSHAGTLAAVARAKQSPGPDIIQLPKGSFTWPGTIPLDFDGVLIRGWRGTTEVTISRLNAREGALTFFGRGLLGPRQAVSRATAIGSDTVYIASSELTKHRALYQPGLFVQVTVPNAPDSLRGTYRTTEIYARVIYRLEEVNAAAGWVRVDTRLAMTLTPGNTQVSPCGVISNVGVEEITFRFNPNMGGTWSHGLWFSRVYNGWVRNIQILSPPSFAWNIDYCKRLTISDTYAENAQNQGPQGNGYIGITACSHCEVRRVNAVNFRHLTIQTHVEFSRVSQSTFREMDLHFHSGHVRYTGFDSVQVYKDPSGKPLAIQLPQTDNPIHSPIGEYCFLTNSKVLGGEWGRLFEIGHAKGFVLAYNDLESWNFEKNENRRAMLSVWDHSDLTVYGNTFRATPNAKVRPESVFFLTTYPAYRNGVQTGIGFYPALTPWTSPTTVPAELPTLRLRIENNTIIGLLEGQKWPSWNIAPPTVWAGNIFR